MRSGLLDLERRWYLFLMQFARHPCVDADHETRANACMISIYSSWISRLQVYLAFDFSKVGKAIVTTIDERQWIDPFALKELDELSRNLLQSRFCQRLAAV
jgi:hypothetical protein